MGSKDEEEFLLLAVASQFGPMGRAVVAGLMSTVSHVVKPLSSSSSSSSSSAAAAQSALSSRVERGKSIKDLTKLCQLQTLALKKTLLSLVAHCIVVCVVAVDNNNNSSSNNNNKPAAAESDEDSTRYLLDIEQLRMCDGRKAKYPGIARDRVSG